MQTLSSENPPDFSVIVPVYNSASTLERLFKEIDKTFKKEHQSYEVIFVDDFSVDGSLAKLKELQNKHPHQLNYISLSHNHGQHIATFCGILHSKGHYIITLDDDLETPPAEIQKLITCLSETQADLVYGMSGKANGQGNGKLVRDAGGFLFKKILSKGAEVNGKGSSFRLFKGDLRQKLAAINFEFIFLDEILHWHVSKIHHTEIETAKRIAGQSGYSLFNLISISARIVFNYSDFPIKLIIWGGTFSAMICFGLGIYHVYNKLFNDVQLGFTSLITSIFFGTGIILFALGIIGEYLRKIYFLQLGKQNFKIKDSSF